MADKSDPKNARWTDDPFWQPQTPEEKEWISKRDAGLNPYMQARIAIGFVGNNSRNGYKVDDPEWRPQTEEEKRWYEVYRAAVSHLVEIGLFPKKSLKKLIGFEDKKLQTAKLGGTTMTRVRKLHSFRDREFRVIRRSPHRATVNVICGEHKHDNFIVGLIDESRSDWVTVGPDDRESDWAVGRKDRGYPMKGEFAGAVEHAAGLLLEECYSMRDIEDFFGEEAKMRTTEKVQTYGGRQYVVASTSPISATANIVCEVHKHHNYVIGLVEHKAAGWVMGRPRSGAPTYALKCKFVEAVENAANLLLRECLSMEQVDTFFGKEVEIIDEAEDENEEFDKGLDELLRDLEGEFDEIDRIRDDK